MSKAEKIVVGRFVNKVVVILGGSSGIGLASAKAFASEGARVFITGRDRLTLQGAVDSVGHGVTAIDADVSDLQQIRKLFSNIGAAVDHIDVLFVNAGTLSMQPLESISDTAWDRLFDINLKGAFFSIQAALSLMSQGSNVILNSSVAAHKGEAGVLMYASSKAGIRAMGRSLAGELVGRGIRVNVVSPGVIRTPIFEDISGPDGVRISDTRAFLEKVAETIPMRRLGSPEEVAAGVLFLASDDAAYITGIELQIDGGAANL